jgi:ParB-like chromosome segregation protein Spo0J
MAKRIVIQNDDPEELQQSRFHKSVHISDTVQHIAPEVLQVHPLNAQLFKPQSGEEYEALKVDVLERGIIVPLIARADNTLLAGHTRLQIAKELRLKSVPVQYASTMSDDDERKFLVNDNLLRRHLVNTERIDLYRILFPDFDSTFMDEKTRAKQGRMKDGSERLTIATIAEETQQKYDTVKRQIQTAKRQKEEERKKGDTIPFSEKPHKTVVEVKKLLKKIHTQTQTISPEERKELRGLLMKLLKSL